MRTRLRYLVVACLLASIVAGGVMLYRVVRGRQQGDTKGLALEVLPHVAQRIRDFHREKIDNGRKVWEISASEAQYHEDEALIVVTEPLIAFFMDDGRSVALEGAEGRVFLGGRDLQRVELTGGIRVQFADYVLHTEEARYERSIDAIVAPGRVEISGRALDLEGERLEIQMSARRLLMRDRVKMVLRPKAKRQDADDPT